jgi:hypothetical protein
MEALLRNGNQINPCNHAGDHIIAIHQVRAQTRIHASPLAQAAATPAEPAPPAVARGKLLICDAGWNGQLRFVPAPDSPNSMSNR